MSRIDRLKEYAAMKGPKGEGRDMATIDYWSKRASSNSKLAPRASDGPMVLPDKAPRPVVKAGSFYKSEGPEMRSKAKADKNFVGSSDYMPRVRRVTS